MACVYRIKGSDKIYTKEEIITYLKGKYPESELLKVSTDENQLFNWNDFDAEEIDIDEKNVSIVSSSTSNSNEVQYVFKAVDILQSDRAKQIFEKGNKVGWDLNKILTELAIPKEQKELLLNLKRKAISLPSEDTIKAQIENTLARLNKTNSPEEKERLKKESEQLKIQANKESGLIDREKLILELNSKYGFVIENKITEFNRNSNEDIEYLAGESNYGKKLQNTNYYSGLTVPGGTNYTENEISTPAIIPSIKGHAQFSTDNGIGWFRSDETEDFEPSNELDERSFPKDDIPIPTNIRRILEIQSDLFQKGRQLDNLTGMIPDNAPSYEIAQRVRSKNEFLNLLNKDNNWVTVFTKIILQDSIKKGYKKVLFPTGATAAKIEGHQTIADEINRINRAIEHPRHSATIEPIMEGENVIDTKIIYYSFGKQHGDGIVRNTESEFIDALNEYKKELKTQGLEKLAPIEHFYTNALTNVLKKIGTIIPITDEYGNTWNEIDLSDEKIKQQVAPIKFASIASSVNEQITGSTFSQEEKDNIFDLMSNTLVSIIDKQFIGKKIKDVNTNELRLTLLSTLNKSIKTRIADNTLDVDQQRVLYNMQLAIQNNDRFWKEFKIVFANKFGYVINEEEEFEDDVKYLEKSWSTKDLVKKNPIDTANDKIKRLINTTPEVDPTDKRVDEKGKTYYAPGTGTPTGFASNLSWNKYHNKIASLMLGSMNKDEMLTRLLKYSTDRNTPLAKSLYNIYNTLRENEDLLNAWYTHFDKASLDSYRDYLRETTSGLEVDLKITETNSIEFKLATKWQNKLVSQGENGVFTSDFIKTWNTKYANLAKLSSNFSKLGEDSKFGEEIVNGIAELYNLIGIDITPEIVRYEFNNNQVNFKDTIITPLTFIVGIDNIPGYANVKGYVTSVSKDSKTIFDQFKRLISLANKTKYFTEEGFNYGYTNIHNNLIYNIQNHSFITNLFKKLQSDDINVVYDTLSEYAAIPSYQHSSFLWGDLYDDFGNKIGESRGFLNYKIVNNKKHPLEKKDAINFANLNKFKLFNFNGSRNITYNNSFEYDEMSDFDWMLHNLIYYFTGGQTRVIKSSSGNVTKKDSALFPLLNPADRGSTNIIEAPITELSETDFKVLLSGKIDDIKELNIFKHIKNTVLDDMIAMSTAKYILFETNEKGSVIWENGQPKVKQSILDGTVAAQNFYHYKIVDGKKEFLNFKVDDAGRYVIDTDKSGNVFSFLNMFITFNNQNLTFNRQRIGETNFMQILLDTPTVGYALRTKVKDGDKTDTFDNRLDGFVHSFISQEINKGIRHFEIHKDTILGMYNRRDSKNETPSKLINKSLDPNINFNTAIAEYVLNTYLYNNELVKFLYGSVADYKSRIDLNKRGGQVKSNGITNTNTGTFTAATISDVILKSKVYNEIIDSVLLSLGYEFSQYSKNKLKKEYTKDELKENKIIVNGKERKLFSSEEAEVYNIISPYLTNDSANAVSVITMNEFVKRIKGFGMYEEYRDIIEKSISGKELNREETNKFATLQKNFYYKLTYSPELQKMIPVQVKNAEVILTPNLIKNLQLERLDKLMRDNGISQLNFESAEKVGSTYIATITDDKGNLLDNNSIVNELGKAKRDYYYDSLVMQQEVVDHVYEEDNMLGRQISKKIIENIPSEHIYTTNLGSIAGKDLIDFHFDLLDSNIWHSANELMIEFETAIDQNGNIKDEISFNKVLDILEEEGLNRNYTKNILFGLQIGDNGRPNVPIWFNTVSQKWENVVTALFTRRINEQRFPGIHAVQMSSVFMNIDKIDKASIPFRELNNKRNIQWHQSIIDRKDLTLRPAVISEKDGKQVIEAEVLLNRWSRLFFKEGDIININDLSDEVRTMIGYRIPTEAKYSMYVFKVVGFLPEENNSAIVLPDNFVTQTGSDFDMDTIYTMLFNLTKNIVNNEDGTQTETIEAVKYIDGNTKADIKRRAAEIMKRPSEMVHVLSSKFSYDTIVDILKRFNEIRDEFINRDEISKVKYATIYKELDSISARIKTAKGKEKKILYLEKAELQSRIFTDGIFKRLQDREEYKEIELDIIGIIENWSVVDQNTRQARENQLLHLWKSILTDPIHFVEMTEISNFKDVIKSKQNLAKRLDINEGEVSNLTATGQNDYRDKSIQARNLKGMSLAYDRFLSIAQVAGITITDRLIDRNTNKPRTIATIPTIKYEITKEQQSKLTETYGSDVSFVEENKKLYAIIKHRYLGNNPNNNFRNIENRFVNSYSAQSSAYILDIIKEGSIRNLNSYTFNIWKLFPAIGSTYNFATYFINQPIIFDLANYFNENINTINRGKEIENIKREYQTNVYKILKKLGKASKDNWDKDIAKNGRIWVKNTKTDYKILGYDNETPIILSLEELDKHLKVTSKEEIKQLLEKPEVDTNRLTAILEHLQYQLQVLETFIVYKEYSNGISDGIKTLSTDKIGAGPEFDVTNNLLHSIDKGYKDGILEIGGVSAYVRIFPSHFGRNDKSAYPTIEQFFKFSNLLSTEIFSEHFMNQSLPYNYVKQQVNEAFNDGVYNKDLVKQVTRYLNALLIQDHEWLNNISVEEKKRLLGIDTPINFILQLTDDNITLFETLSVANQLELLKINSPKTDSIIWYLETKLREADREYNGYHKIVYQENEIGEELTRSFNELWYSDNIYERIVARNILRYDYLTNGFNFGFTNVNKIIPSNLFAFENEQTREEVYSEKGIGLSSHLYKKQDIANNILNDGRDIDEILDDIAVNLFGSEYQDKFIRANWTNTTIVPDASTIQSGVFKDIKDESGNVVASGSVPLFVPNPDTHIIRIPARKYEDVKEFKLWNKVRQSKYIKLKYNNEYVLFKRSTDYVQYLEDDTPVGNYYYYPVGKLEPFETSDRSLFEENNKIGDIVIKSESEYRTEIARTGDKLSIEDVIYPQEMVMNMTTKQGKFREGLEAYNTTMDLVRAGLRTATTRKGGEADRFKKARIGDYIKITDTNEYIKVTREMQPIMLGDALGGNYKIRDQWSKDEGWDKTYIYDNKLDENTDLFQMKYKYIGKIEDVLKDSGKEIGDGEINEGNESNIKFAQYTSSTDQTVNNVISTADTFVKNSFPNLARIAQQFNNRGEIGTIVDQLKDLDVEQEITTSNLGNLAQALSLILKFNHDSLLAPPTAERKGGIVARIEEYENIPISEILKTTGSRKDFIGFIKYAHIILARYQSIEKLTSTSSTSLTTEEQTVNTIVTEIQKLTPTVNNARTKLNTLLEKFYEADLIEFSSNPDIREGLRRILDPGDDESYTQYLLDAMSDTNNSFVANLVKKITVLRFKGEDETRQEVAKFENIVKRVLGKSVTSLTASDFNRYYEVKNGKLTGRLISKYDYDKYRKEKAAFFADLKKTYGVKSDKYKIESVKWRNENEVITVTDEEVEKIIAAKQKELSTKAFEKWYNANFYINSQNGIRYFRMGDSGFKTPSDKYITSEYNHIKDDELYQYLVNILGNYGQYFGKENILTKGYIPTMTETEKKTFKDIANIRAWYDSKGAREKTERYTDDNNEYVYILKVPMVQFFSLQEEIKIRARKDGEAWDDYVISVLKETAQAGRGSYNSLEELKEANRKIRQENEEYHAGKINYNLAEVIPNFIKAATDYKYTNESKHEVDLAVHQIRNLTLNKRTPEGKLSMNRFATKLTGKEKYHTQTGKGSNLEKHFAEWVEAIFYGNFDIDEGDWTKISKILMQYTSAKNMWFNVTAGISNVAVGKMQVALEAAAGWYLNKENLRVGDLNYIKSIPDFISTLGTIKSNTLEGAIVKKFDITQNTNERDFSTGMLHKYFMSTNSMYFINNAGEHCMQNTLLFGMLDHHRIIDGNIVSAAEYRFNNYKKALLGILSDNEKEQLEVYLEANYNKEEFKESKKDYLRNFLLSLPIEKKDAFIEAKKTLDKDSNTQFESYPKVSDIFELEDGVAVMKDSITKDGKQIDVKLNNNQFELFRSKIIKVNQKCQGIYNTEDASTFSRRAMGKMLMQFKKYMRPGWNKRFGSKFGKSFWTESRDEWDKGMYVSTFQFLISPFKRQIDEVGQTETFFKMMGRVLSDLSSFSKNVGIYWNTLDDFEKGNIKRTAKEMIYLCAVIVAATMLRKLEPDDDEPDFAYDLLVYELDRMYSELILYNPTGIGLINETKKMLRSPAAVQTTLIDSGRFIGSLIGYPFQSPEDRVYQAGVYRGETKLEVNTMKLIPIVNKIQQLKRINKFNRYYMLFRG